jgi:hypothetical protein
MSAPDANVGEVPPGAGFVPNNPRNVPVFFGCAQEGPLATPTNCNAQPFGPGQHEAIQATYAAGPLTRKATYVAAKDGAPCLCVRLPKSTRAAWVSPVSATLAQTSTITPTVTGTPTDGYDMQVVFTAGGTLGQAGGFYKTSEDGGATFSAPVALGTNTAIPLPGTGMSVGLGAPGEVFNIGDTIAFWTRPASAAILPAAVTASSASTATHTPSGSPEDAYQVQILWVDGGTVGAPGAVYRVSLDGGLSWGPDTQLGSNVSIALFDGYVGTTPTPSGVNVGLNSGGIVTAGDLVTFETTAPEFSYADLQTAWTKLRATPLVWSFGAVLSPMSASEAGSLDALVAGWATGTRRAWAVVETRGRSSRESVTAWRSRLLNEWITVQRFASTRVFPAAGGAQITDPITARKNRRSAALHYLGRLAYYPISTDSGEVDLGPLTSDVTLFDTNGNPVDYDARTDPSLFDAGFLTLRTWEGWPGVYPTGAVLIAPPGDINLIAYRRVLDAVEDAVQTQMRLEMIAKFRVWPSKPPPKPPYKAGDIFEADARAIESRLRAAARNAVLPGDASDVALTLQRTPVAIAGGRKKLVCKVKVTALDYIYGFEADVGIVDPALDALLSKAA